MVGKWLFNLLKNGVYWGYKLLANLLLTSWDPENSDESTSPSTLG